MNTAGDFVITWQSEFQDLGGGLLSHGGVYGQHYSAAGVPQGGEFRVNTYTTDTQAVPSVAIDATGNFAVAWHSLGQDGSSYGVYAQRYGNRNTPTVGTLSDTPDPVTAGNSITLSAGDVISDGIVTNVAFYRETNGDAGLQVGFDGDTLVGTDTTPSAGIWEVSVSTTGLPSATYTYWAQATDDVGLTGAPASTTNTVIGGVGPSVTGSSFLFDTLPQRIAFTFDQNVGASLSLADFIVQRLPAGPTVTPDSLSYDSGTNTATLSFNSPLPDGNYRATALAAGITNSGGTPMAADVIFNFFFLSGDANHDARVNLSDFNILAANFGQSNRNFSQGDFNYDTVVNLLDFNILASRFGQVLGPSLDSRFGGVGVKVPPTESGEDPLSELLA